MSTSEETKELTLYFYKAEAPRKEGNTDMLIPLNGYPPVLVEIGDQPVTIAQGPHAKQSGQNNFADYWTTDKTTVTIDGSDTIELSGYTLFTSTTVISVVFQSESLTSKIPFQVPFNESRPMYESKDNPLLFEGRLRNPLLLEGRFWRDVAAVSCPCKGRRSG